MAATPWTVDAVHSSAEFGVSHMGVSTYRGRFRAINGTLLLDEGNPQASSLEATIEVKSLELDPGAFYDKLMGEEFFAAAGHPQLRFRSQQISRVDPTHWKVSGELTIRGVTRPLELAVEERGGGNNPFTRKPMKAFHAHGALDRGDYGMKWNVPLDNGGKYLGEKVTIDLLIEVRQP